MNVFHHTLVVLATLPVTALLAHSQDADSATIRIGTYDSRAIAIAYAASDFNPVADRMKDYEKAKSEGDTKLVKELDQWGKKLQRQLHRQGFSVVPVGDLLKHVNEKLPSVAKSANVVAIVRACDYTLSHVEEVDVTDQLVKLFDPSDKTREIIRQIKDKPPVDLDDVEQQHEH